MNQIFKKLLYIILDYWYEILILCLTIILSFFFFFFLPFEFEFFLANFFALWAFGFSLMTLRKTFSQQANVHLVRGLFLEKVRLGSSIPIIFYNSGNIPTYFKILKINTKHDHFKIVANRFEFQEIGNKKYEYKTIEIYLKEGGDIKKKQIIEISVKFAFCQRKRIKIRNEQMTVKLVPKLD